MYPAGELKWLAARKALLRLRIAEHRLACAEAAATFVGPLETLDRGWALWKQISPFAKAIGLPAAMLLGKKLFGRGAKIFSWARLLPLAIQAMQFFGRKSPGAPTAATANASSQ